jgi:hypothetical protein
VSHSGPFYNRRIGSRIAVDGARLGWRPILPRRRFRREQRADSVKVADLSITGALVIGPRDARVRIGTQVEIDVGGQRGVVEIRRIDADPDPALAWYGVQCSSISNPNCNSSSTTPSRHDVPTTSCGAGTPPTKDGNAERPPNVGAGSIRHVPQFREIDIARCRVRVELVPSPSVHQSPP